MVKFTHDCLKLSYGFTGKPIHSNDLKKIESIVNQQIKDELDVFAKEATLADAKRIVGLRAVFGEVRHFSFLSFDHMFCHVLFKTLIALANLQCIFQLP